jgi:hypothetical protein
VAACVRDKLMVPPFAAKAEPGSSAAITMHKTNRIDASPFSVFTLTHKGISRMQRPGADSQHPPGHEAPSLSSSYCLGFGTNALKHKIFTTTHAWTRFFIQFVEISEIAEIRLLSRHRTCSCAKARSHCSPRCAGVSPIG